MLKNKINLLVLLGIVVMAVAYIVVWKNDAIAEQKKYEAIKQEDLEAPKKVHKQTEAVEPKDEPQPEANILEMNEDMVVVVDAVNVRINPDPSSEKIKSVAYGETLHVTALLTDVNWYRVDADGSVGYVIVDSLKSKSEFEQNQQTFGNSGNVSNSNTSNNRNAVTYNNSSDDNSGAAQWSEEPSNEVFLPAEPAFEPTPAPAPEPTPEPEPTPAPEMTPIPSTETEVAQ